MCPRKSSDYAHKNTFLSSLHTQEQKLDRMSLGKHKAEITI